MIQKDQHFGNDTVRIAISEIIEMIKRDTLGAIQFLWTVTMHALVVWIVIAPPVIAIIYFLLCPVFRSIRKNIFQKLNDNPTM